MYYFSGKLKWSLYFSWLIGENLQNIFKYIMMYLQISRTPDLEWNLWEKRCGLHAYPPVFTVPWLFLAKWGILLLAHLPFSVTLSSTHARSVYTHHYSAKVYQARPRLVVMLHDETCERSEGHPWWPIWTLSNLTVLKQETNIVIIPL